MLYRDIDSYKVSSLCFGTATFVAGKLRPELNSEIGISSLKRSLALGVNLVHSNSNLGTQWAIKRVLEAVANSHLNIRHLIKIETPVGENLDLNRFFSEKVREALRNLGTGFILGIIHEIDVKRTSDKSQLSDPKSLTTLFRQTRDVFEHLKDMGSVGLLIGMAHNPLHMRFAIDSNVYDGLASYYNLFDNWATYFFEELHYKEKAFIGIRPLKHGLLTERCLGSPDSSYEREYEVLYRLRQRGIGNEPLHHFAVRFALAHPVVKSIIVGMSCPEHVDELIDAARNPLPFDTFQEVIFEYRKLQIVNQRRKTQ